MAASLFLSFTWSKARRKARPRLPRICPISRQHRAESDIAIDIVGLKAKQFAVRVLRPLQLPKLSLRLAQGQIGVGNIRFELDGRLKGRHRLVEPVHARQCIAVKKSKPHVTGLKRAGPFEHRCSLGKTSPAAAL